MRASIRFVAVVLVAILFGLSASRRALADTLYVGEDTNTIATYDTTSATPTPALFATTGRYPDGLTFDSSGNLFVANFEDNTIDKVTPGGSTSVLASTGVRPNGLAFDPSGNLYLSTIGDGSIEKITQGGAVSTFVSHILFSSNALAPMVSDAVGNLYVTTNSPVTGDALVLRITPGGSVSTYADLSSVASVFDSCGLSIDSAGNLYVGVVYYGGYLNSISYGAIDKITPGGSISTFASLGSYTTPSGLAFDGAGNLYALTGLYGTIDKIAPNGAISTFVTGTGGVALAFFSPSVVPEPSGLALLGVGSAGLLIRLRRGRYPAR